MKITRALFGDIALAVLITAIVIIGTARSRAWEPDADRTADGWAMALAAATGVALVARRRWPRAVLAVSALLLAAYLTVGYPYGPIFFSFFIAVYTVARYRPLSASVPVSLGAVAVLLVHLFTNSAALPGWLGVVPASAWVVVPFALGTTVRLTREAAEREQAEALRRRVDEERLQVVHEVHDIVGHGLAAIKMQSDVALHLLPGRPERAEAALQMISRTSSEALEELRATLAVKGGGSGEATRAPVPGLARLAELTQRMAQAGVQVDLETVGTVRTLPAVADITGYRIVQEALTNVLKHSTDKVATVRVAYQPDAVVVTVSNPVPPELSTGDGLGISGMRRRVESLGGAFTAGPTSGSRFEVRATIPTDGAE